MTSAAELRVPSRDDVWRAADLLDGVAHRTPVFTSTLLDQRVGVEIFVKCESFQRGGAFKFRGAYNAISRLGNDAARGVVAFSSGNHAQAVALTGALLGVPTTIVMPTNAPLAKLAATRGYGAEVVMYDPARENREAVATRIAQDRGATVIPPYDHPDIVAGQGTAALELLEDAGPLDVILVPCGGGGLLSGSALAADGTDCTVIGVEPELADDAARTLRTGELHTVSNPDTVADGLRTPSLGRIPWAIIRSRVPEIFTVSEREIAVAMRFYWSRMKLVVEPSGAVSLAAALRGAGMIGARRVGVIMSGGNVDPAVACKLFEIAVEDEAGL